jgi:hypothetical protein
MVRPKILVILLLAVVVCGAVVILVPHFSSSTGSLQPEGGLDAAPAENVQPQGSEQALMGDKPTVNRGVDNPPRVQSSATNTGIAQNGSSSTLTNSVPGEMTPEATENLIAAKVEELQDLSTKSDQVSMEAILAEVKSPFAKVRAEAVEAIIQFRSRDAIPALKQLATQTEDAHEKAAILEAAEFLELPTLEEFMKNIDQAKRKGQQDVKKSLDTTASRPEEKSN